MTLAKPARKEVIIMKKTLTFEGAGCVPVNDVENCRIRTAFINDKGEAIYLELLSGCRYESHVNKQGREKLCTIDNMISVDFCFYLTGGHDDKTANDGGDDCNKSKVLFKRKPVERSLENYGKYTKEGILAFVNKYCHCSFTDIEVANEFDNYRVYGGDNYNLMEAFPIDYELRAKRAAAFAQIDKEYRDICHSKYSVISHSFPDAKTMKITCHASDENPGKLPAYKNTGGAEMNNITASLEVIKGNLEYLKDYTLYDMRSNGKIRKIDYEQIRETLDKNIANIAIILRETTSNTLRITLDNGDIITTKFNGTAADYLHYCGSDVVTNTITDDGEHEKTEVHKIINVEEAQQ